MPPLCTMRQHDMQLRHVGGNRVPDECPQAAADVVEQCLHEDSDVRPSAREVVEKLSQLREPSQN